MVTKAIIQSINRASNRCVVRMPLFENAAESAIVEAEALTSITPGFFNNLFVGDVVFVAFEENALEQPVIIGKLYRGAAQENSTPGGAGIVDTLQVNSSAVIPASTVYNFQPANKNAYKYLDTPNKVADYIKWLEKYLKQLVSQVDEHFRCFKNWTQWRLRPENMSIDDGDIDTQVPESSVVCTIAEGGECQICGVSCPKDKIRSYRQIDTNKNYPNI